MPINERVIWVLSGLNWWNQKLGYTVAQTLRSLGLNVLGLGLGLDRSWGISGWMGCLRPSWLKMKPCQLLVWTVKYWLFSYSLYVC